VFVGLFIGVDVRAALERWCLGVVVIDSGAKGRVVVERRKRPTVDAEARPCRSLGKEIGVGGVV